MFLFAIALDASSNASAAAYVRLQTPSVPGSGLGLRSEFVEMEERPLLCQSFGVSMLVRQMPSSRVEYAQLLRLVSPAVFNL